VAFVLLAPFFQPIPPGYFRLALFGERFQGIECDELAAALASAMAEVAKL